jgi:hypothetical protein
MHAQYVVLIVGVVVPPPVQRVVCVCVPLLTPAHPLMAHRRAWCRPSGALSH